MSFLCLFYILNLYSHTASQRSSQTVENATSFANSLDKSNLAQDGLEHLTADSSESHAVSGLLQDPIDEALLMSYSACLCNGVEIRDQAAVAANPLVDHPVAILSGTHCEHRSVRQTINAIGGVPALCFLLAQVRSGPGGAMRICFVWTKGGQSGESEGSTISVSW